jgi:hypothetical protein
MEKDNGADDPHELQQEGGRVRKHGARKESEQGLISASSHHSLDREAKP